MTGLVSLFGLVALSLLLGAAVVAWLARLLMWLRHRRTHRPPAAPAPADAVAQLRTRNRPDAPRPDTT